MWIVKSNVSSIPVVGPSSERNKFQACFSLTKGLRSKPLGTQLWRLWWHSLCARRGNMKLETTAVFRATWMCVTLTESWDDRTCSVVVIWTRRNWQLAEHPRCDNGGVITPGPAKNSVYENISYVIIIIKNLPLGPKKTLVS